MPAKDYIIKQPNLSPPPGKYLWFKEQFLAIVAAEMTSTKYHESAHIAM
jgi:hypothetical protein